MVRNIKLKKKKKYMTQLSKTALEVIKQLVGEDSRVTIPLALMEAIQELRTWSNAELSALEEENKSVEPKE